MLDADGGQSVLSRRRVYQDRHASTIPYSQIRKAIPVDINEGNHGLTVGDVVDSIPWLRATTDVGLHIRPRDQGPKACSRVELHLEMVEWRGGTR